MADTLAIQAEIIHPNDNTHLNGRLHSIVWLPANMNLKVGDHISNGDLIWEVWKLYPNCRQMVDIQTKWRRG